MEYLFLILGLVGLIIGGEFLVRGAVAIAYRYKLSPLVVGMTIVSFGTSAPELLVSLQAALTGSPDIAIGNVIGSNISNLALVLAITAMIFPMPVKDDTIRIDWPMMMGATVLFYLAIVFDNKLNWYEGLAFVMILVTFVVWLIKKSRTENKEEEKIMQKEKATRMPYPIILVILGCVGLAFGAKWLLDAAKVIVVNIGISEHVISVTIIAFGTSVPELTTSCLAAFRKQTDISLGNLIGSNLFNILAILGITGMVKEIKISAEVFNYDIFWLLGLSLFILPLVLLQKRISRIGGVMLFAIYISYLYFLLK
ncbi:MAG: calcium/sodium antiporter [Flavobacteriales bacterium]|nr:calcium/sodium antiporter [Flavobacteriales bacterium]